MGLDACVRVEQARAAGETPNPRDVEECERARQIQDLVRQFYLLRFFPPSPFPPVPGPIRGIFDTGHIFADPSPQPSVFSTKDWLFSGLFLDTLSRDPTPTPMINQIRESGVQLEVAKDLLHQFEGATKTLKIEIDNLEKSC